MSTTNDKITVIGKSAKDLSSHYDKINKKYELGLAPLNGTEGYQALQKLVGEAQTKIDEKIAAKAAAASGETIGGGSAVATTAAKVYVFLKSAAYVDAAGEKRVGGGFYHIDLNEYPRLRQVSKNECIVYGEEVPTRDLTKIAEWFGVNPEKHKNDEELLSVLLTTPTLY